MQIAAFGCFLWMVKMKELEDKEIAQRAYCRKNNFHMIGKPKKRWTKQEVFDFCAYAAGGAPIGYDVQKELKYHGISVDRFDKWFKEWDEAGRPSGE